MTFDNPVFYHFAIQSCPWVNQNLLLVLVVLNALVAITNAQKEAIKLLTGSKSSTEKPPFDKP
ncbi:hypothetical protein PALI_a3138 [Pseudoalteromonas aliena SW19]|uniref:Uncharacterized protein n=1 Tax=Pseudoalteromonas aliena SW19 TaxID=1314866 RepID=A0ABR9E3X4_9GAMM|nr:hypothetical protein [Pseudoalteromonas aliena SW19]